MRWPCDKNLLHLTVLVLAALSACSRSSEPQKDEPVKRYELRGEVKRLEATGNIAAIQHEQIGDWMGAMTMEFPVKDPAEFAKLHTGQQIRATVFVQGYQFWVGEIQEAPPGSTLTPISK